MEQDNTEDRKSSVTQPETDELRCKSLEVEQYQMNKSSLDSNFEGTQTEPSKMPATKKEQDNIGAESKIPIG